MVDPSLRVAGRCLNGRRGAIGHPSSSSARCWSARCSRPRRLVAGVAAVSRRDDIPNKLASPSLAHCSAPTARARHRFQLLVGQPNSIVVGVIAVGIGLVSVSPSAAWLRWRGWSRKR